MVSAVCPQLYVERAPNGDSDNVIAKLFQNNNTLEEMWPDFFVGFCVEPRARVSATD
jgi:hypothetical protein